MSFDIFRGEKKKGSIYPACSRRGWGGCLSLLSVIRGTLSDLIWYHFSQVSTPKQTDDPLYRRYKCAVVGISKKKCDVVWDKKTKKKEKKPE